MSDTARSIDHLTPVCIECGYCLKGISSGRCPECGRAFDPADARTYETAMSTPPRAGLALLGSYACLLGFAFTEPVTVRGAVTWVDLLGPLIFLGPGVLLALRVLMNDTLPRGARLTALLALGLYAVMPATWGYIGAVVQMWMS